MLKFITGPPGNGKSRYATQLIVDELRLTKRNISTNVPLRMLPDPEHPGRSLPEYLHETFGEEFDCQRRIRILTTQEMFEFWRFPAKYQELTERVSIGEKKRGVSEMRIDFTPRFGDPGTLFVLDEVHEFFNARDWQRVGEDCLFYLSQHRKLRDDIFAVTQHYENVDRQFRAIAQDYTVLRNLNYETFFGFRLPGKIIRLKYLDAPTKGAKAIAVSRMNLDIEGLCRCYDTAAGAGVQGAAADVGIQRRAGIPWQVAILGMVAIGFLLVKVPDWFGAGVAGLTNNFDAKVKEGLSKGRTNSPVRVSAPGADVQRVSQPEPEKVKEKESEPAVKADVFMVGYARLGGSFRVYLSDGRVITSENPDLEFVATSHCIISGKIYRVRPAIAVPEKEDAPAAKPVPVIAEVPDMPQTVRYVVR